MICLRGTCLTCACMRVAQGAEEMGQMELLLNVYTANKAKGAVADFMGHCLVEPEEATRSLTPGLWLVRGRLPGCCIKLHSVATGKALVLICATCGCKRVYRRKACVARPHC